MERGPQRGEGGSSRIIHSSRGSVAVALGPQLDQDFVPLLLGKGNIVKDRHQKVKMSLLVPSGTVRHLVEYDAVDRFVVVGSACADRLRLDVSKRFV